MSYEVSMITSPILWMRKLRQGCEVTCSTQPSQSKQRNRLVPGTDPLSGLCLEPQPTLRLLQMRCQNVSTCCKMDPWGCPHCPEMQEHSHTGYAWGAAVLHFFPHSVCLVPADEQKNSSSPWRWPTLFVARRQAGGRPCALSCLQSPKVN